MPARIPSALGLALTYLRTKRGWSKKRLGAATGIADRSLLARLERGLGLSREKLDSFLAKLGYPPEAADVLLFADRLLSCEQKEPDSQISLTRKERARIGVRAMAAGWHAAELVYAELIRRKAAQKDEAARQEAEELWAELKIASPEDRRDLIACFPEVWSVPLAARVCEASRRAAADDAEVALELAELALSIAERVPGASLRSRAAGYCWAYVANARRVKTDFDGADEAFARAWELWRAGAETGSELLPEWRLLSLEASLRREQRRYSDSLDLLARAWAAGEDEPEAAATILLKKQHVFEVMGDIEAAVTALAEAAPHIEASGDPDLLFRLDFKRTNHLCHLKRYDEAAALLPRVRELAIEQANALDLVRVVWLAARIAAGRGRLEEAIAGLEQVRRDFRHHELPYEEALASLDLAVLWLKAGRRTAEVRELAVEMEVVFRAKKIHREALAALRLFCDAARQNAATAELAREVIAEIERVRHSASSRTKKRPR